MIAFIYNKYGSSWYSCPFSSDALQPHTKVDACQLNHLATKLAIRLRCIFLLETYQHCLTMAAFESAPEKSNRWLSWFKGKWPYDYDYQFIGTSQAICCFRSPTYVKKQSEEKGSTGSLFCTGNEFKVKWPTYL